MPRYCAVKGCSNRGGSGSRLDNKRISFYPFPLQDKPRLQKWVDNIKRENWTPSQHQCLCSEHFTEDCVDIRWGIRYLKPTAVPTIFPTFGEDGDKKVTAIKKTPNASNTDNEHTVFDSTISEKPLILSSTCKSFQSSPTKTQTDSYLAPSQSNKAYSEEPTDSSLTVLYCQSLAGDVENNVDFPASVDQGLSFVEVVTDNPTGCFLVEQGPCEGEHVSFYEHSYCRSDTDEEKLWRKILSLHAKILELDQREENTVAKINALETEIAVLKRDGAAFKERQKVLEDYLSSVSL